MKVMQLSQASAQGVQAQGSVGMVPLSQGDAPDCVDGRQVAGGEGDTTGSETKDDKG